jgi:signal transduction histidine kinase/CheY-like chemotaxis protein
VTRSAREEIERRVVILAPTGRDATLTGELLAQERFVCVIARGMSELVVLLNDGAGTLIVAEEAIANDNLALLAREVVSQPVWSDLPVLVLTRQGADSPIAVRALQTLGNVTLVERPTRVSALVSAVRTALRGRARQYQTRTHLQERERAASALRDADRRKDEFLAMLAHELRNPLAPASNAVEVLRMSAVTDPTARDALAMLERQIRVLVRLVDDLLDVARITRGKVVLRKEPVELARIVGNAVETSRPLMEMHRHRLTVTLPTAPVRLDADAMRLSQVFANLLNNAAKYTDAGGEITVAARVEGEEVVVTVRDTGVGIPADRIEEIFDMFTQLETGTDRAHGGLGVGLRVVRSLVEMHGGRVAVKSAGARRGSEFTVRLPLADGTHGKAAATNARRSESPARYRVLIVDDNRDAAVSLGMVLRLQGAEVHTVYDGPSALAALERVRPIAVVLDLGMAGMDGYEVARRIRRDPRFGKVALIALSGWGQEDDFRRTRDAGFDHHLVKPPDLGELQSLLSLAAASDSVTPETVATARADPRS